MASSKIQRLKSPVANTMAAGNLGRQSPGMAKDYAALSFKELLAACPLEGIELTRERDLPRDVNL